MVARVALSVQRQVRCLSCDVTREVNFMAGMRAAHKPALRKSHRRTVRTHFVAPKRAYLGSLEIPPKTKLSVSVCLNSLVVRVQPRAAPC